MEEYEQNEEIRSTETEESPPPPQEKKMHGARKALWTLLFVAIAALSVFAVTSQSRDFSFSDFIGYVSSCSPGYFIAAVACMLGFILFEGFALTAVCRAFGHRAGIGAGYAYSAADIYFSAITPSATGGQPASAYFMMRDGIPGPTVTVALFANLIMYTLSIIVIGIFSFALRPGIFLAFGGVSKALIILGCVLQLGLAFAFFAVLRWEQILRAVCAFFLRLFARLHLIRSVDRKLEKLTRSMEQYRENADAVFRRKKLIFGVFLLNLLQRASQITVTMFAYLAAGGDPARAADIWAVQSYTVLGSNCMPIPGAMGVSDYLLLDAFGGVGIGEAEAVNLELLSRSLSLYICILICGISILIKYILQQRRRKHDRSL